MVRLRARHLPHRVDITPLDGEGAEGDVWGTTRTGRPAYVEMKTRLVVDQRRGSETFGQEVEASAFIVLLLDDDTLPRSKVRVGAGTPRERESEVIRSDRHEYPGTPSHVELFTT